MGQGIHDRLEAYLFADGAFVAASDLRATTPHLPARVKAISAIERIVAPGETLDVSVRGEVWGVPPLEDLYCVVNFGRLVLRKGARLIVRGNIFSMICQELICESESDDFHIGILPTPFPQDFRGGTWFDGHTGEDGAWGARGHDGSTGPIASTLFGPIATSYDVNAARGARGGDGATGARGERGRNGGPCKTAEITIRRIADASARVIVFAQPGAGGRGGDGGRGGEGGRGGDGAPSCKAIAAVHPRGAAGDGGRGGNGGDGNHGGNGGIASNIFIDVPADQVARVTCRSLPGDGGAGGKGGRPGRGGDGGDGDGEPRGIRGQDGRDGADGRPGRSRPAPPMFINGRRVPDALPC